MIEAAADQGQESYDNLVAIDAARLTSAPFRAVGTREAVALGLLDDVFGENVAEFRAEVRGMAERLAHDPAVEVWLAEKRAARALDEARRRFVYKLGAPCAVQVSPTRVAAFAATGRSTSR